MPKSLLKSLSKEKQQEIEDFLINRYNVLSEMRKPFDDEISEDVDLFNNKDEQIDTDKEEWEGKSKIPYIYTIVQTMFARIHEAMFGSDNYLRVYVEDDKKLKKIERTIQNWLQSELDRIGLRKRSRDFIEEALVQRTSWLQARPTGSQKNFTVEMDVLDWYDVWFDPKVRNIEDTDFLVRKIKKLYKIAQNTDIYSNIDEVKLTKPPDEVAEKRQRYESMHNTDEQQDVYYDPVKNSTTDQVELLEWYGEYDISENPDKPNYKEVIFVIANRKVLVRAEINDLKTIKKRLFFPIRPLRQANSLIGKGVPQITKDQQKELNEFASLRLDNTNLLVKLLFKYKRDAGIEFDELNAEGGNAIGFDDNPDDIQTFEIPDKIRELSIMMQETIQTMQQTTGAVDYLMGTSGGRGTTETASGIQQITEQALFKFGMMATNVYFDLLDFINYVMILHIIYGEQNMIKFDLELDELTDQDVEKLEHSYKIDIGLNDLAIRRDIERSQFINAINILLGTIQQVGGNPKALLRQVMERLNMEDIDELLSVPPEQEQIIQALLPILQQNPEILQQLLQYVEQLGNNSGAQTRGGSALANPQAFKQSMPEEESMNQNPERPT